MSLPLSPERLRAVYECLRAFPPFNEWGLPVGEAVRFHVTRHKDRHADFYRENGTDHIRVSTHYVGRFETLAQAVAHEMAHQYAGHGHGAAFKRAARAICKRFGWDEKTF